MSSRSVRYPAIAGVVLTVALLFPGLAATTLAAAPPAAPKPAAGIVVPDGWGPQLFGWGDVMWFRFSTGTNSCRALSRDGWTVLANLPWLHRLVAAAPHPRGSIAAAARARLLASWPLFARDARRLLWAAKQCPTTLAGREAIAARISGELGGPSAPPWAARIFDLYAVLYQPTVSASCRRLDADAALAQADIQGGLAHARYFGRAVMTTHPDRWQHLIESGATCIVRRGGEQAAGVSMGLTILLGAARAENGHDRAALARIRDLLFK